MKRDRFTNRKIFESFVRVCIAACLSCILFLSNVLTPGAAQGPPDNAPSDNSGNQLLHLCNNLPNPPGNATGHDRHCPQGGSSAGVALGDFNGDGFADLSVGVPNEDIGNIENAGAVNVIYGSTNGLTEGGGTTGVPVPQLWHQNVDGVGDGAEEFDHFGSALAAGDFNGDGFSDLAIGVPDEDGGQGIVQILFGSLQGLTSDNDQILNPRQDTTFLDGRPLRFGAALTWGNFNGDVNPFTGRPLGDLAVGMPNASQDNEGGCSPGSPPCLVTQDAGGVLIYTGSDCCALTFSQLILQDALDVPPNTPNFVMVGDLVEELDRFGSVLTAGDFDDDDFDDLVIGVPNDSVDFVTDAGVVHVAFGSPGGISNRFLEFNQRSSSIGLAIPNDAVRNNKFGQALAVGDFDGDGFEDLAIGTPGEAVGNDAGAGTVYVLNGDNLSGISLPATAEIWHQDISGIQDSTQSSDNFGKALAAGDFDADGFDDLAIGVPGEDLPDANGVLQQSAGAVNVIYGGSGGLDSIGDQLIHQGDLGAGRAVEAGDLFGSSLTAWNFGRNERRFVGSFPILFRTADLAVGIPGEDLFNAGGTNLSNVGALNVLYGNSISRLSSTGNQLWHQNVIGIITPNSDEVGGVMETNDLFGAALY